MNNLELPGFGSPSHPKLDQRVFSLPDGAVELLFQENVPTGTTMPDYRIFLATSYGTVQMLQGVGRTGLLVRRPKDNGGEDWLLRLCSPQVRLKPYTYTLTVMDGNKVVWVKSLTVLEQASQRLQVMLTTLGEEFAVV